MGAREGEIRAVLTDGIARGVTPGAVAHVRRGDTRLTVVAGTLASHPGCGALVTIETGPKVHYDLASLTKVLATTTLFAGLVTEGDVALDAPVPGRWRFATGTATLADLLAHRAGLEAHREFFVGRRPGDRAGLMAAVAHVPPATAPGPVVYSDLGFLILGDWLESRLGIGLDQAFARRVARPLGLEGRIGFRGLDALAADGAEVIAPTEVYDPSLHEAPPSWLALRRAERFAHGRVHDDNAVIAGGVAGHAGLFGDAEAVAEIAVAWLREPGRLGISTEVRDLFMAPTGGGTRRLGWDGPSPDGSGSTGSALSMRASGHLGYTGTSVWLDPATDAVYVLLTNRVHPTRARPEGIRALRREFHRVAAG